MSIYQFSNNKILYIDEKVVLSYRKGKIIYYKDGEEKFVKVGNFLNKFSIMERLLRLEPRCAVKVGKEQYIISINGFIYNYNAIDNKIKIEQIYNKGMKNPIGFTVVESKKVKEPDVYYGEYIWNEKKGPVSIFMRKYNKWLKVYEFPANTITHIHNIIFDKFRNGFVILTGDNNQESGIWFADLDFQEVFPVIKGKQQYRSCVAFIVPEGIIYATDTPLEQNYIYFIKNYNIKNKLEIVQETEIPGPCIYGTEHCGELYFSTSVEPDSSLPKWKYRLTYRLGKGVKSRNVHIIKRSKDGHYENFFHIKKDLLPIWLFQFGNIQYPNNKTDKLLVILQGTKGHGKTFQIYK